MSIPKPGVMIISDTMPRKIPAGIKYLEVGVYNKNSKFESIPPLPEGLIELNIAHQQLMQSLPPLPSSLRKLTLNECPSMKNLESLPPLLTGLGFV